MKKTAAPKKPSMKEAPAKENPGRKRFKVELIVEGDMLDKDTPIGDEALKAFFLLAYSSEKPIKITGIEVSEVR